MALFDDLKTAIKQAIKPNNAQEITGQTLQNTLLQMVDDLGTEAPYTSIAKGVIDLNFSYDTLDQYNSIDKKGWYALSHNDSGILKDDGGFMLVTADDMGHVIHQFIFSDYTVMDGEIGSHQDGTPSIVVRTYNVNSPTIKDIPKGSWGKWKNYLEFPQSEVTGYAVCSSGASIASKVINRTNFELSDNCRLLVEMNNANSAASGVTLNINNTGAKPLFYNGSPASASNTWQAGDILDVFYDGTYYHAIRFGLVDTYPPLFLTMSKSGTKDVLEGATPIALREALSVGRNVIITDQNHKDNYVVSVSYSPLAITVCNPNGKLMRLDLVTDDGIIEYTQTDLSQYSPLVLDVSNCWHTTSNTQERYQNVDLGATAAEIKAAADGNQRIVLSNGKDRMYPVTAIGISTGEIIGAMYLGKLCTFSITPNSGNAQNCDVTLSVIALQTATQTGS